MARMSRRRGAPGALVRRRVGLISLVVLLVFTAVVVRLVQVQVMSRKQEVNYAASELVHSVSTPAQRGEILADDGQVLAMSVATSDVVADPHQVTDPRLEAGLLAPLLGLPEAQLQADLSEDAGFVYLARQVASGAAAAVTKLNLAGITEQPDSAREYPEGPLTASLVGALNAQGVGSSGLEYQFNSVLAGRSGREIMEQGANGITIPGGVIEEVPTRPGAGLVLTIDPAIQYEAQQALAAEMSTTHATQATAIVVQSRTGDILGAVGLTRGVGGAPTPAPTPIALTNVYEPGSVMKLSTYALAITDHLITPSTPINVPAELVIDGDVFHDAESHPDETLTATQCLDQSSNICTIEVAEKLGPTGLYGALRDFGYGEPTGLGFPGTSPGLLPPPSQWSGTSLASTAIGQAEAVNLVQIADAYDTIADGGVSVPPHLVTATIGADGSRRAVKSAPGHRVVPSSVARSITTMLEGVVSDEGTAPAAAIPGYTVAGKTGTAQIPNPDGLGYLPGAYDATFAGFAPAQDPAVTVVVCLSQPNVIYGGSVAAPVAAHIMSYALQHLEVPPPSGTTGQGAGSSAGTGPALGSGLAESP